MFQVRNKEVLKMLAGRQMKKSRQRNGIAVGAIILTTVLFSTLFTVGGGVLEQAQQSLMRTLGGTNQATIKFLSMPEYERVKEAGGYEKIGYSIVAGSGADERLQKINTEVRYAEDYVAQSFRSYPTRGNMPEEKMEIAASGIVLETMGLSDELGSRIVFPIDVGGTVHEDTFTLCGVWEGDPLAPAQEIWISKAYCEEIAPTLMTSFTEGTPYEGCVMAEIDFSNTWNLERKLDDLLERSGLPGDTRGGTNPVYTEFQMDPGVLLTGVILLTAILVSGYLIIYNVFYISVTQDIQFYGLLKTIGASGKQLRRIVFRQAMKLSCIGIPLGLLAGYAVGLALLPVVMREFSGINGFGDYKVSPLVLAGAAVFSLLTVYISFRSPGCAAAGVSPIEAVCYNGKGGNDQYRQGRMKKIAWLQKDVSLILGFRNLRRDGKKAVLVIVSLALSMTLLNTTYTILKGFDLEKYVESQTNGDFEVTDWTIAAVGINTDNKNLEGIDAEFEEAVRQLPGLERFEQVYAEENMLELPADVMKWMDDEIAGGKAPGFFGAYEGKEFIQVYAATGGLAEHAEYKEGTFDVEKWAQGNYVVYDDAAARYGYPGRLYQPGDSITLEGKDGQKKEYTVMAIGTLPFTMTTRYDINLGISVLLPEQEFVELYGEKRPLCVVYDVEMPYREEAERITAQLAADSDKVYISFETLRAEFQQSKQAYSLIGGIVSLILGGIGILNFVNIIVTGILTRQKELAMLSAVGMGGRQMKKMLIWESVAYIGSAALLTATAGNLVSWILCQSETVQNQWAFVYHFTFLPVAVCLPVLLAAAMAAPLVFYQKVCKKSVVERLRSV